MALIVRYEVLTVPIFTNGEKVELLLAVGSKEELRKRLKSKKNIKYQDIKEGKVKIVFKIGNCIKCRHGKILFKCPHLDEVPFAREEVSLKKLKELLDGD